MTNYIYTILLILCLLPVGETYGQRDLEAMKQLNPNMPPPINIDEDRVIANGIQKIESKHVVLYTDIRDRNDVAELITVFEAAVPQWCDYFEVEKDLTEGWQLSAFIVQDKARFDAAGLFPRDLPNFPAGYNVGHHMWVYLQPGDYYTRHLFLHEGTHAFMQWFLGGSGPPWYSEGMAEMLAVHRWADNQLELNYRLRSKEEAEYWGRVKILREDYAAGDGRTLENVFRTENVAFRVVRNYAWAWAACKFLSEHPLSKAQFNNLGESASDMSSNFSRQFFRDVRNDWEKLEKDWKLFIAEMNYGIQIEQLNVTDALESADANSFSIDATRGWQKTQVTVQKGQVLEIVAKGRFQVADEGKPWPCEAGGVTIEYYRGHPLGKLMVGILAEEENVDGLLNQQPVGLKATFTADRDGVLCFRINESPAKLDDNSGSLQVTVGQ